jgi:ribosomal protein S12 methylthiotransferase accessory factor
MTELLEPRLTVETPLDEAVRRLRTLISPLVGPILGAYDLLLSPEAPALWVVVCHAALTAAGRAEGTGCDADRDSAFAAAAGEAVERYAVACPPAELVTASANELGDVAVDPARFALYRNDQLETPGFPAVRFDGDTVLRWTRGFAIPSGESVLLPAQLVHWIDRAPAEPAIGVATSNGLACGGTLPEAVLTALLELCERDAFAIVWANRLSLPLLDWRADPELSALERRAWARTGLRYEAVDLSCFWGIPCVLAVARSESAEHAPIGVGAGCARTVQQATRKAIHEALFTIAAAQRLRESPADRPLAHDGSDIRSFDDHVRFYAEPALAGRAAFLDASSERRSTDDVPPLEGVDVDETLEALAGRLAEQGAEAYAVDVTPQDIRDAGLAVARVVAPELCPLDVDHGARQLGPRRLYETPWRLGLAAGPLDPRDLNPDPHPFP